MSAHVPWNEIYAIRRESQEKKTLRIAHSQGHRRRVARRSRPVGLSMASLVRSLVHPGYKGNPSCDPPPPPGARLLTRLLNCAILYRLGLSHWSEGCRAHEVGRHAAPTLARPPACARSRFPEYSRDPFSTRRLYNSQILCRLLPGMRSPELPDSSFPIPPSRTGAAPGKGVLTRLFGILICLSA